MARRQLNRESVFPARLGELDAGIETRTHSKIAPGQFAVY